MGNGMKVVLRWSATSFFACLQMADEDLLSISRRIMAKNAEAYEVLAR